MPDLLRRQLFDTAFRGSLGVALYAAFPAFSDIYRLWERSSGNPRFTQIPFEYPPVSALYFWPLASLPSSRWAVVVNGLIMVGASVVVTWLLARRVPEAGRQRVDISIWVASPALLLLLPVNWDVLVCLIAVVGVFTLFEHREAISGFWLGLGAAFKVFPAAIVLPALPLIDGWRRKLAFLFSGGAVLGLCYAVYGLLKPDEWLFHLQFASVRMDIDSTVWDLLDRALGFSGLGLSTAMVNTMSTVALIAALTLTTAWVARARPNFAQVAAVALIALLVFNKVFKPQYVLWVLPFFAWIGVTRWKVRTLEAAVILQFAAIYFPLPTLIFPVSTLVALAAFGLLTREILTSIPMSTSTRPLRA